LKSRADSKKMCSIKNCSQNSTASFFSSIK